MSGATNLYGRKADWDPLKSWLEAWNNGSKPEVYPFIIIGESGWGKSTLAHRMSETVGMAPTASDGGFRDGKQLQKWFGQVRSRSFTNEMRVGILDDASFLSGAEWKLVGEQVKMKAFPMVVCVQTDADVPWPIRKGASILKLEQPKPEYLHRFLETIEPDRSDLWSIANLAASFRQAELILKTTPEGFVDKFADSFSERIPSRTRHAEVVAILQGKYPDTNFTSHPLAILQAANHNHADPEQVGLGSTLHGMSWKTDLLEPIARGFLVNLRTKTWARPPFRKLRR